MATGSESLQGPRLEFVVREVKGTIERMKIVPPKGGKGNDTQNTREKTTLPAGFIVYTPAGQCYRMGQKELIRRGFHRSPGIINLEQANNTETPAGRFKLAIREEDRMKAYREMEDEVIRNCVGKVGKDTISGIISDYNPDGQIVKEAA